MLAQVRRVSGTYGPFVLAAQPGGLRASRLLPLAPGPFVLTGSSANGGVFVQPLPIPVETGSPGSVTAIPVIGTASSVPQLASTIGDAPEGEATVPGTDASASFLNLPATVTFTNEPATVT